MSHKHHWLLIDGREESDGVCRECGAQRHFSGGLPESLFGQSTLAPVPDDGLQFESLEELANRELSRWSR